MEVTRDEAGKPAKIRMRKPTDLHQHFRQGAMLKLVAPMVAKRFRTAIIMPNLDPPVTTCSQLDAYTDEIRSATGRKFWPMMTMYLTDTLKPSEVRQALSLRKAIGIKFYPPGLTTNSDKGIKDPIALWTKGTKPYQCLQELADYGGVFLIHAADGVARSRWKSSDRLYRSNEELDPYDQEKHFIEHTLPRIQEAHPKLKISVEHLSTKWGVDYLYNNGSDYLGCSLTAHHLLLDRRDIFRGGFRPHRSWMPVIQPKEHKDALLWLAQQDLEYVWLGSDSAPHPREKKESDCCASGVLMAHAGIELYAEAFEDMGALDDRFERFASINGRKFYDIDGFYGLNPSDEMIDLVREEWVVNKIFEARDVGITETTIEAEVVPFRLGEKVRWKLVDKI